MPLLEPEVRVWSSSGSFLLELVDVAAEKERDPGNPSSAISGTKTDEPYFTKKNPAERLAAIAHFQDYVPPAMTQYFDRAFHVIFIS